jgi:hypothetical protein
MRRGNPLNPVFAIAGGSTPGASGDVRDVAGGLSGTRNGGAAWVDTPYAKGLSFDGSTGYALFGSGSPRPTTGLTVSLIVRWASFGADNSGHAPACCSASWGSDGWAIYQNTSSPFNRLKAYVATPGGLAVVTGGTSLTTGVDYAVALTYDGATARIYLNGQLDASAVQAGTITYGGSPGVMLGRNPIPSYFAGQIPNALIYPKALSAAEIARDYADPTWFLRPDDNTPFGVAASLSRRRRLICSGA